MPDGNGSRPRLASGCARRRSTARSAPTRSCNPTCSWCPTRPKTRGFATTPLSRANLACASTPARSWRPPTVCRSARYAVLDYVPRDLNEKQRALLRLMARQIMKLLDLRRLNARERELRLEAEALVRER